MATPKIYRKGYRIRKAYGTAFRVLCSYFWLYLKSKIFGKKYYQNRIFNTHVRNAERIKKTILKLQGLFIKVGQLLSILTNFLPKAFHEPLEALQNKIPARPFAEIQQRIVQELGNTPEELFASFNQTALASASIGQVHRATLKTGEAVVVKVQHQNIESVANVDLTIIQRLVKMTAYFFDIKGMEHAYTQVRKMVEEELDFRQEASAMQVIGENLKEETKLRTPKLYEEYSTERILTSEYIRGVKISDTTQLDTWQIDKTDLANRLVHAYCKMVFEDGFYHADPHPGNILVQEDGTIIFLDFGAVAHVAPAMRTGLLELIDATVKNDSERIIITLRSMGFIAEGKDAERAAEKMIDAFRYFIQNEVEIDGLNFKDIKVNPFETSLFNLTKELGFSGIANTVQVPKEYVLLNRMATLLLGICSTLDSSMNPIKVLKPYLQKYMLGEKGNIVQYVTDMLKSNVTNAIALPTLLHKTVTQLQKGKLEIQVDGTKERNRLLYVVGQQLILTLLLIAAACFTFLFYHYQYVPLLAYGKGICGMLLFLLLRSVWRNRKRGNI